jgi:hypothetical protein
MRWGVNWQSSCLITVRKADKISAGTPAVNECHRRYFGVFYLFLAVVALKTTCIVEHFLKQADTARRHGAH